MGATPLYLAIILAQANAYLCASAMLRLSGTVDNFMGVMPPPLPSPAENIFSRKTCPQTPLK